jgi:hypothetical protein
MKMMKITKNTLISSSPFKYISHFYNNIWLAVFALVITISACDNPDLTNFKTTLTNDTFGTRVDIISLIIRTKKMDPVPSYNFTKDLIGCYHDGITGTTVASSFFNFRLPSATIKLPTTVNVNSVILTLRYAGKGNYFGNITEQQTFNIYELTQKLKLDSAYYSSNKPAYNQNPIGVWKGSFNPDVDTILNLKLSEDFCTTLGKKLQNATKSQLSNNDSFQAFFKGMCIVPDSNVSNDFTGAIVYFLLNNAKTTLTVHYNDTDLVFPVNSYSARFNNFKHNFEGSIIQKDTTLLILQPLAGTQVTIKIPNFKHLIDSGLIAIHKAEITFPLDEKSPYNASAPSSLLLLQTDLLNQLISIADRTENYYGGLLNTAKTSYSFIITRYFQQLLKEYAKDPNFIEKNTLTLIIPSDNPITASPVILKNAGDKVVKLKIWYSRL